MLSRRASAASLGWGILLLGWGIGCIAAARTSTSVPPAAPRSTPALATGPCAKNDDVNVTFVTWNLAQCSPSKAECAFLSAASRDSAVVVIGLQEVEVLKPRRQEGGRSRLIRRLLLSTLGGEFAPVSMTRLGSIQMFVFVRKSAKRLLDRRSLRTWEVSCGIGNVLQNKGALGLAMSIGGHRLAFIAAHLAAHQSKVEARNGDYWRIMRESEKFLSASENGVAADGGVSDTEEEEDDDIEEEGSGCNVYAFPHLDDFDCIVFGGDLNYRLDLSREEVQLCLEDEPEADGIFSLLDYDQLTNARTSEAAFGGFAEGSISFPPTFKYDKTTDAYDTSKKRRVPAWTDRILYKASPGATTLKSYRQVPDSRHSDHRAVLAQLLLRGSAPEDSGDHGGAM